MKRSEAIYHIAEALLQSTLFGGDEKEREEVRESSKMGRLKMAHIALEAMEAAGVVVPPRFEYVIATGEKYDRDKHYGRDVDIAIGRWESE